MSTISFKYGQTATGHKVRYCELPRGAGFHINGCDIPGPELDAPNVDAVILDGAVIVNMLKPGTARTFSDYSSQVFLP